MSQAFAQHPSLWLEDGNVVLIAQNTGFRVHRSILARHSEVFRDMFMIPQPQIMDEVIEGCPVIRLTDEGEEELATILGILYDGGQTYYKSDVVLPFKTIAYALRLGTKFQFNDIRREALARLSICFPNTLAAFHDGVSKTGTHSPPPGIPLISCPIEFDEKDAVAVLHMARSYGLEDLIPAAIYTCVQLPISFLFECASNSNDKLYILSQQELQECMEARVEIHQDTLSLYNFLARGKASPNCERKDPRGASQCRKKMKAMVAIAHDCKWLDEPAALSSMDDWIDENGEGSHSSMCKACVAHAKDLHNRDREKIWTRLRNKYATTPGGESEIEVVIMDE